VKDVFNIRLTDSSGNLYTHGTLLEYSRLVSHMLTIL